MIYERSRMVGERPMAWGERQGKLSLQSSFRVEALFSENHCVIDNVYRLAGEKPWQLAMLFREGSSAFYWYGGLVFSILNNGTTKYYP